MPRPTPRMTSLIRDLKRGHNLYRRPRGQDCLTATPGTSHAYTAESRRTADGLVTRGLARWIPCPADEWPAVQKLELDLI